MPRGKPAGGDEQIASRVGDLGLEEPQELPHRCISNSSGQLPVGHHSQDVEIFEANDPTGPCQLGGELVLHIPPDIGNLLMLACHASAVVSHNSNSPRFVWFRDLSFSVSLTASVAVCQGSSNGVLTAFGSQACVQNFPRQPALIRHPPPRQPWEWEGAVS